MAANDPTPAPVGTVELGDGLTVSRIGFGGMALSHVYGRTDPTDAIATLDHALDIGVTFLDTANVYGEPKPGTTGPAGTNEELFARVLAERRDEVQLATKFDITGMGGPEPGVRGDRDYVRRCCDESLARLGVDVIDLYYMHRRELDRPIEETVGAMGELVVEGKVRHLGLSEVTGPELRAAVDVHPIAAVQSEWSIWSRDVENQVVPACVELGVGFVPYSPLGRGFLTGTLDQARIKESVWLANEARFGEHYDANQQVVDVLRDVAGELEATPSQVAIAWLYRQGERFGLPVVPIPGTRRAKRVTENAGAVALAGSLTDVQLDRLDRAADLVEGDRGLSFNDPKWISAGRE